MEDNYKKINDIFDEEYKVEVHAKRKEIKEIGRKEEKKVGKEKKDEEEKKEEGKYEEENKEEKKERLGKG